MQVLYIFIFFIFLPNVLVGNVITHPITSSTNTKIYSWIIPGDNPIALNTGLAVQGNAQRSIAFTFKVLDNSNVMNVIATGNPNNRQAFNIRFINGKIALMGYSYDFTCDNSKTVLDGKFHDILVTWDQTTLIFYVDGEIQCSYNENVSFDTYGDSNYLGQSNHLDAPSPVTSGIVTNIFFYDYAILPTDIIKDDYCDYDNGWRFFNGNCYKFYSTKMTWTTCASTCADLSATMLCVDVNDGDLRNFLGTYGSSLVPIGLKYSCNGWEQTVPNCNGLTPYFECDYHPYNYMYLDFQDYPDGANYQGTCACQVVSSPPTLVPTTMPTVTSTIPICDANTIFFDISNLDLSEVPDYIQSCTSLQKLHLNNNVLTSLPVWIGSLTSLQDLDISSNQLSNLPEELGSLVNLVSLSVSNNQQINVLPTSFVNLGKLKSLDIGDTSISSVDNLLCGWKSLNAFFLKNTKVTSLPKCIGNARNLNSIDASGSYLSTIPKEIGYCHLTGLDISHTNVLDLPWTMNSLQYLNMPGITLNCLPPYLLSSSITCFGCSYQTVCEQPTDIYKYMNAVGQCASSCSSR